MKITVKRTSDTLVEIEFSGLRAADGASWLVDTMLEETKKGVDVVVTDTRSPESSARSMVSSVAAEVKEGFDRPINSIGLSVRAIKCAGRLNARTVGELTAFTPEEILAVKNVGSTTLREIEWRLKEIGMSLREPTRRPW